MYVVVVVRDERETIKRLCIARSAEETSDVVEVGQSGAFFLIWEGNGNLGPNQARLGSRSAHTLVH